MMTQPPPEARARLLVAYEAGAAAAVKVAVPWGALEALMVRMVMGVFRRRMEQARLDWPGFIGPFENGFTGEPQFWAAMQADLRGTVLPVMERIALQGVAAALRGEAGPSLAVDWSLANMQARNWAQQRVGLLVTQVTDQTKQQIRDRVARWIEQGGSVYDGGLADEIASIREGQRTPFGIERARLIAQTESTNSYAAGNVTAWSARGYTPPAVQPSLHPGCRCYLVNARLKDGSKVLVWRTVTDGRVCLKPINSPVGRVNGCTGLKGRIVSSGPHLLQTVPQAGGLYQPGSGGA